MKGFGLWFGIQSVGEEQKGIKYRLCIYVVRYYWGLKGESYYFRKCNLGIIVNYLSSGIISEKIWSIEQLLDKR
jgi:hypothetical protein